MRVTIIPVDGFVSVDGEGYSDLDLTFMDADIHSVQWYGADGEVERKNNRGQLGANEPITSLNPYQPALDAWQVAHDQANAPKPEPTPKQIQAQIINATQNRLDTFARTRNYDGILSLCTYATSTNAKFAAEGQYGVEARDTTWSTLDTMLAEVYAGARPMPESYADIEGELPALEWPV